MRKYLLGLLLLLTITFSQHNMTYADSSEIVTLGANLNDTQKETVLSFFGLDEEKLNNVDVLTVTNQDERKYLEGVLSDSIIGTRTFSCAYIQPTVSGGINIKTANLTYVTASTLYNALQTAGIENCNLIVTAPFEVSGTGALTGVFMAFETDGEQLDEDKKQLASEELVTTAELERVYGSDITDMLTELKQEVIESDEDLSDEDLEVLVNNKASEYNITPSTDDIALITNLLNKLQELDYNVNVFKTKLEQTQQAINEVSDKLDTTREETKGFFAKIAKAFQDFVDWFKGLFSKDKATVTDTDTTTTEINDSAPSIFDNVDTSIFQYDNNTNEITELMETTEIQENTVTQEPETTETNSMTNDASNVETEPNEVFEVRLKER